MKNTKSMPRSYTYKGMIRFLGTKTERQISPSVIVRRGEEGGEEEISCLIEKKEVLAMVSSGSIIIYPEVKMDEDKIAIINRFLSRTRLKLEIDGESIKLRDVDYGNVFTARNGQLVERRGIVVSPLFVFW